MKLVHALEIAIVALVAGGLCDLAGYSRGYDAGVKQTANLFMPPHELKITGPEVAPMVRVPTTAIIDWQYDDLLAHIAKCSKP